MQLQQQQERETAKEELNVCVQLYVSRTLLTAAAAAAEGDR